MGLLTEYLFGLFESILLFEFLTNILKKRDKVNVPIIGLFAFIYSIIILYSTSIVYFSNLKIIILIINALFFVTILYKDDLRNKIIFTLIYFIILVISDIFVANTISIVLQKDIVEIITKNQSLRLIMFCGSKVIVFSILRITVYFTDRDNLEIPIKYWYKIISTGVISLIILMIICDMGFNIPKYSNKSIYFVATSMGILIINIIIYDTFIQLGRYFKKEQIYNIIDVKNEMMQDYYIAREESHEETRKLIHDFKNHLLCISFLIKDNNIVAVKDYVKSINEVSYSLDDLIRSGNNIVDAVLNQKLSYSEKLNIDLEVNATIEDKINIESIDLCAVLSNLIDNAIEASIKIDNENNRKIKVKINEYKDYLFISISNISKLNPLVGLERFKTTKLDRKNHGLGIKIVENVVGKYNGSIEYDWEEDIFTVKVLLGLRD